MLISEKAFAKVNLVLEVVGKRPDGYHELRTVFQSLQLHDLLTFSSAPDGKILLTCNDTTLPVGEENLVVRAAKKLQSRFHVSAGAQIVLGKNIPVAAGLGGGSSDAAAALRGLVRLWQLPVTLHELHNIAAELGSDVPFCLDGGTQLGSGRGEILTPLAPCPHFHVVLANPGIPVPTQAVYRELKPEEIRGLSNIEVMADALSKQNRPGILALLTNALEPPAFRLFPEVKALKEIMGPAALMCGSGGTVLALCSQAQEAYLLVEKLKRQGITHWVTATNPGYMEV